MRNYLSFELVDQHAYIITITLDDDIIGELFQEFDGHYAFYPTSQKQHKQYSGRALSSWELREIAEYLDVINKSQDAKADNSEEYKSQRKFNDDSYDNI